MGGPSKTEKDPLLNEWAWLGLYLLAELMAAGALIGIIFAAAAAA